MSDIELKFKFEGKKASETKLSDKGIKLSSSLLKEFINSLGQLLTKINEQDENSSELLTYDIEIGEGSTEISIYPDDESAETRSVFEKAAGIIICQDEPFLEPYYNNEEIKKIQKNLLKSTIKYANSIKVYSKQQQIGNTLTLTQEAINSLNDPTNDSNLQLIAYLNKVDDMRKSISLYNIETDYTTIYIPTAFIKDLLDIHKRQSYLFAVVDRSKSASKLLRFTEIPIKIPDDQTTLIKEKAESSLGILDSYKELKANWDGYKALPINEKILESAKKDILSLALMFSLLEDRKDIEELYPHAVPIANGSIQFEWEFNNKYLEIEFLRNNKYHILTISKNESIEREYTVSNFYECFYFIYWILERHHTERVDSEKRD